MEPTNPSISDPIVVWGGGAIGGTLAAFWARAGIPVILVDLVQEHVQMCRKSGLSIEGPVDPFTQIIPAMTPAELTGVYSRIVLAVKAQNTAAAMAQLLPHLAEDGFILSAQNGLNELTIAEIAGEHRTMGCYVGFGADWHGPGRIVYGGRGEVVVGEIDKQVRPRTIQMHRLLRIFEPQAVLTNNVWGYLWSKLGLAAMLLATALDNDGMDVSIGNPDHFPVFDELGREVMRVASARGITPEPFRNFDPLAFMPASTETASRHAVATLARRWDNNDKKHSGFWRDLAVRKRRTEVEPLMGAVAELGKQAGIDTPAIHTLIALIHDVEEGRRPLSAETFNVLLEQCVRQSRAHLAAAS